MLEAFGADTDTEETSVVRTGDLQDASGTRYELAIVGGGIYGLMLALEAAQRGFRVILVERDRFGAATSRQSLRIIHGGLRYLQSLDFRRFGESVAERRWFLRTFPQHVRPLPCLMPLYGRGLRSPAVLRAALAVNDVMSFRRNAGVGEATRIPRGRMLNAAETVRHFPEVDTRGLRGAALWTDAVFSDPGALVNDVVGRAAALGAVLFERVEATTVRESNGRVTGLGVIDRTSGDRLTIPASTVVNCAGPWCRGVAARFDRDVPQLFRPSLAFNLLLRRPLASTNGLAVTPRRPQARTYFVYSTDSGTLAGTYHAAWNRGPEGIDVDESLIAAMLDDLNAAVPAWNLQRSEVAGTHAGLLPVTREDSVDLLRRHLIHNHGEHGGLNGVYSVSGVKLTTARLVAERVLNIVRPG